jgi:phosphoglycerate kinase
METLTLRDLDVKGKKVLLRVDFNVPLNAQRQISDNTRIVSALPTIRHLLNGGGRLIILSHLGRPDGKPSEALSLRPIAEELGRLLGQPVHFSSTLLGPAAQSAVDGLRDGDCILMENVRFYPEEEQNDRQFAKELAALADVYVNDAFGTAHRAHASNVGVVGFFDKAACGLLIEKELTYLEGIIRQPQSPFCAIIGGAKVKDKISVISNLMEKADDILIGGGMAYTFLAVQGQSIGNSLVDQKRFELVRETLHKAETAGKRIHLPQDHVVGREIKNETEIMTVSDHIPDGYMGLDIGPKTVQAFVKVIEAAKTVIWNGPMGVFELPNFQNGTFAISRAMAASSAVTVVGGGDSVAAINQQKLASSITHISTGGGASLELLEGKQLPGIAVLKEKFAHGS